VLTATLISLTAYRLTRFLVRDSFPPLAVQRARIGERWGDRSWQAYLASCSWCAGVYVAGAVTLATDLLDQSVPLPVLVWGAAAAVTGLLAGWERVEPDE
jgi:hypothetical protein